MKCPKCGLSLPADSEFCQYCGIKLGVSQSNTDFVVDIGDSSCEFSATSRENLAIGDCPTANPPPEQASEISTMASAFSQQNELLKKAYHSFLSTDSEESKFFEQMRGTPEMKAAYLEECQKNKQDHDNGIHVSFKESYMKFMGILHDDFFGPVKTVSQTSNASKIDAPPVPPTAPVPSPKKKSPNQTCCKKCGAVIDPATKKCTGCGKQYFKGAVGKTAILIVVSILLIASVILNVSMYLKQAEAQDTISSLTQKNSDLKKDISNLKNDLREYQAEIDFVDEFVVFVEDDGTDWYHKYECNRFLGDYFWAFNIDAAEQDGYEPCPYCYK